MMGKAVGRSQGESDPMARLVCGLRQDMNLLRMAWEDENMRRALNVLRDMHLLICAAETKCEWFERVLQDRKEKWR